MRNEILKTANALIAGLLSLLGFSTACDDIKVEYGVPSAKFVVNGKVTSAETNQPIKGVLVKMSYDTTYTDENGKYQVVDADVPTDQTYTIQFKDVDGSLNGVYNDLDTIVEFKDPKFTNGSGDWYEGEATKNVDVKLSSKNDGK